MPRQIRRPEFRSVEAEVKAKLELDLVSKLRGIHSVLDDALGDTDVTHMDDEELRDAHPVQWAAQRLAEIIETISDQKGGIKP